jgi:CheY-like chemotaxis protein
LATTTEPTAGVSEEDLKAFSAFLADKKIVVADNNKTIRATIARSLVELGAKVMDIALAASYADAVQAVRLGEPDLIFADYHLDTHCGLELISEHRKVRPDVDKTLFILVTSNATESAVAEAAEGDVDAFVLKPFTLDLIKRYIVKAGLDKIRPTGYRGALAKGKEAYHGGKYPEAIEIFRGAKKMFEKPSLACYYEGQCFERQTQPDTSKGCYQEGLTFNEIHYRCSIALFDVLVQLAELESAYRVIQKISDVFPISPQRLCKTIEIAVRTHHYEDVGRYYDIFINLDERREDLKRYLCAALVVGAMYQLRKKNSELALELLKKAAITAGENATILREIVLTLVEHGAGEPAKQFLKRFPPETQHSRAYLTAEYAVLDKTGTLEEVLVKGRALVKGGIQDILIYKILIRRTAEAGFAETAEALAKEAGALWPGMLDELSALAKVGKGK